MVYRSNAVTRLEERRVSPACDKKLVKLVKVQEKTSRYSRQCNLKIYFPLSYVEKIPDDQGFCCFPTVRKRTM